MIEILYTSMFGTGETQVTIPGTDSDIKCANKIYFYHYQGIIQIENMAGTNGTQQSEKDLRFL